MKITPLILCGGSGTRLWPLSRQYYPKQFLRLAGKSTLFQQSVARAVALQSTNIELNEILIVTNEQHRFLVLEQLDEMKLNIKTRILLEPKPLNTAPALTLAALASQDQDLESILVVTPADHFIKDEVKFVEAMHLAIGTVQDKMIITLGIKPTQPDIGLGYIAYLGDGLIKTVQSFTEKPNIEKAQAMLSTGNYAWNAGIFILKSQTWDDAIQQAEPKIHDAIIQSWQQKSVDRWFERPNEKSFNQSPSNSIDYAVMEQAQDLGLDLRLVELDAGWSDLGSFDALDDILDRDENQNITQGDVVSIQSKNNIALSTKKNISLVGVENLIVIETADAVLVADKKDAQSIKKLVQLLEKNHSYLLKEHTRVYRPWGWFETMDEGPNFKVKRIQINPSKSISLQKHQQRSEHWVVVRGQASIIKDDQTITLLENESTYIKKNQIHRLTNNTKGILQVIEVQTGNYLGEDDIERIDDYYGR